MVLSSPANHKCRSAISNVGEWSEASTVHFHFFSIFSASHLLDIWNEIKRHKDICNPKFSDWWPSFLLGKLLTCKNIPSIKNSLFQKDSSKNGEMITWNMNEVMKDG